MLPWLLKVDLKLVVVLLCRLHTRLVHADTEHTFLICQERHGRQI